MTTALETVVLHDDAGPAPEPAITRATTRRSASARAVIVVAYVVLFWCVLPYVLFAFGKRIDGWLGLASPGALARELGTALALWGLWRVGRAMLTLMRMGQGLPISHLPPRILVRSEGYARARHPIYLAFSVCWIGSGLALHSWGAAIGGGVLLTLAWIAYARVFEEPRLLQRFGDSYRQYAQRTRLLPLLPERWRIGLMRVWLASAPSFERLANHTTLYRGKRFAFVTYGVFVGAAAWLLATASAAALIEAGAPERRVVMFALCAGAATLIGGRLVGLLYRARLLLSAPKQALRTIGFVSFGGYAGLGLSTWAFASFLGMRAATVLDCMVLPALLASAIGRLGCLSYGCCGGKPWAQGLRWRNADARIVRELGARAQVARVPTQLMSCAQTLMLALLLLPLTAAALPPGALSALAALLYGLGRVSIEQAREEQRFSRWQLTRGQFAALGLAALGLVACLCIGASVGVRVAGPHLTWTSLRAALPIGCACGVISTLVTGVHSRRIGYW